MAEAWPDGIPSQLLRNGASYTAPDRVVRSPTDSGLARQRAVFSASTAEFSGVIRMSHADVAVFVYWRDQLGGAVFDWPSHPWLGEVEARFVAGRQGAATPDPASANWLVPVGIEVLP